MKYEIQVGQILNVAQVADSTGDFHPTLQVQSLMDGAVLDVPLAAAGWEQSLPIPGYMVCFVRYGQFVNRVIKIWGRDEDFVRKGNQYGLFPGEVFIQSPSGFGYFKIDRSGRVYVVSGDQASALQFTESGAQLNSNRVVINTTSGVMLEFAEDGSASLTKVDSDGNVLTKMSIDKDANFSITTTKDVSIKAQNIFLDGTVWSGSGATDPIKRNLLFGDVVTSGPFGTHPFDLTTGAPIPGSSSVKVAK